METDYHSTYTKKKFIFRTNQVIWYVLGVIEVLLTFRFLLKMFGANPFSGFVNFIYALSEPFAAPFRGVFGITASQQYVFEWTTLVGMVVYGVLAYGIIKLIIISKPATPQEVESSI